MGWLAKRIHAVKGIYEDGVFRSFVKLKGQCKLQEKEDSCKYLQLRSSTERSREKNKIREFLKLNILPQYSMEKCQILKLEYAKV